MEIKIEQSDIVKAASEVVTAEAKRHIASHYPSIKDIIRKYFNDDSSLFNKSSKFEDCVDWAIENSFRVGVDKALKELKLEEMIFEEIKIILSNGKWLRETALKKVASALGIKE